MENKQTGEKKNSQNTGKSRAASLTFPWPAGTSRAAPLRPIFPPVLPGGGRAWIWDVQGSQGEAVPGREGRPRAGLALPELKLVFISEDACPHRGWGQVPVSCTRPGRLPAESEPGEALEEPWRGLRRIPLPNAGAFASTKQTTRALPTPLNTHFPGRPDGFPNISSPSPPDLGVHREREPRGLSVPAKPSGAPRRGRAATGSGVEVRAAGNPQPAPPPEVRRRLPRPYLVAGSGRRRACRRRGRLETVVLIKWESGFLLAAVPRAPAGRWALRAPSRELCNPL